MAKRIFRFFANDFETKLFEYINENISLIYKKNLTFKGKLIAFDKNAIKIKLKSNTFKEVLFDEISEIQIDKQASH